MSSKNTWAVETFIIYFIIIQTLFKAMDDNKSGLFRDSTKHSHGRGNNFNQL